MRWSVSIDLQLDEAKGGTFCIDRLHVLGTGKGKGIIYSGERKYFLIKGVIK